MKPSIGRVVIIKLAKPYNGSHEQPAIVTRVWGPNEPAAAHRSTSCINVKVLPDCHAPFDATSVSLFQSQAEAEASGHAVCCWWPERA